MLSQIEDEQKKKLEQIEIMEREKSIIPYSFANSSSATKQPKEVYKAPETMVKPIIKQFFENFRKVYNILIFVRWTN